MNAGGVRQQGRALPEMPLALEALALWADLDKRLGRRSRVRAHAATSASPRPRTTWRASARSPTGSARRGSRSSRSRAQASGRSCPRSPRVSSAAPFARRAARPIPCSWRRPLAGARAISAPSCGRAARCARSAATGTAIALETAQWAGARAPRLVLSAGVWTPRLAEALGARAAHRALRAPDAGHGAAASGARRGAPRGEPQAQHEAGEERRGLDRRGQARLGRPRHARAGDDRGEPAARRRRRGGRAARADGHRGDAELGRPRGPHAGRDAHHRLPRRGARHTSPPASAATASPSVRSWGDCSPSGCSTAGLRSTCRRSGGTASRRWPEGGRCGSHRPTWSSSAGASSALPSAYYLAAGGQARHPRRAPGHRPGGLGRQCRPRDALLRPLLRRARSRPRLRADPCEHRRLRVARPGAGSGHRVRAVRRRRVCADGR